MTWGKFTIYPANTGHKGDIFAQQGWLHMNAYIMFLSPLLQRGSQMEEKAKDRENLKLQDTGIRGIFGKDIVPKFCSTTAKLSNTMEGGVQKLGREMTRPRTERTQWSRP